jgi:hypothetical protein
MLQHLLLQFTITTCSYDLPPFFLWSKKKKQSQSRRGFFCLLYISKLDFVSTSLEWVFFLKCLFVAIHTFGPKTRYSSVPLRFKRGGTGKKTRKTKIAFQWSNVVVKVRDTCWFLRKDVIKTSSSRQGDTGKQPKIEHRFNKGKGFLQNYLVHIPHTPSNKVCWTSFPSPLLPFPVSYMSSK